VGFPQDSQAEGVVGFLRLRESPISSGQSIRVKMSLMNKELLFLLYGSPSFRAFSQIGHWQTGLGVGVVPPEPTIVRFIEVLGPETRKTIAVFKVE
jgi:hypothetical protein